MYFSNAKFLFISAAPTGAELVFLLLMIVIIAGTSRLPEFARKMRK